MLQYTFTATPVGGGTPVVVTSIDPDVRFYGLLPNTQARACSVISMGRHLGCCRQATLTIRSTGCGGAAFMKALQLLT